STPVPGSIAPTLVDLLPCKSEGGGAPTKDGICTRVEFVTSDIWKDEEFEAEASAGGMMKIAVDPLATGGISESTRGDAPDLEGTLYDIAHYMSEENIRVRTLLCIERDHVDSVRRHMALSQKEFCQIHKDRDNTRRRLRRLESLVKRHLGFRCYFGSTMVM
nr:hypothetical protein [Tanacetum cinerariifolium]